MMFALPVSASAQSLDDLKGLASSDDAKALADSLGGSLSDVLQSQLGLSPDQADGSIGSILALAGEKLSRGDYDEFADMIPGADGYLDTAKKLGAVTGQLNDVAGLQNALSSLGIPADTVARFAPMVTDYVDKFGGENIQTLLQQVLN